jgi:hypothetical protein|tara:strand:+ start:1835 stop:2191 length:357 start_codon:yes stop_codon:yes gene_type:complete
MKNKFGIPGFDEKGYFKKLPLVDEGVVNDTVKLNRMKEIADKMVLPTKEFDAVDYPSHYNQGQIQCIDAIASMQGDGFKYYLQGSAVKYIWRHEHKGKPVEDLDKAIWFLNKLKAQYD